ncbi:serine hydrolase domain-containing protein [Steroidobacter sp.]|uniref:serine hydrolase domain-containing protein n=1 Tax=Steroidobacter sp. TaxID=1978227 RepID=UPI001A4C5BFE|nr:serine hydrolase domain-containing protein [Steroidobacter sp.]MBL8270990.1 beta-lactamase family protein [Steroidobacter sp.]
MRYFVVIMAMLSTLCVEAADLSQSAAVDALIAAEAPFGTRGNPGFVVGVARHGKVLLAKGYGDADLEHDVPISADSAFYVASVSKAFTGFAIALLVREGKVDLAADIRRYLRSMPDFGAVITVRDLVEHTGGLRDYGLLAKLTQRSRTDWLWQEQAVNLIRHQRSLMFEPGSKAVYSNTGYLLLAEIVRSASGKSLREFTAERMFAPLGMSRTVFADDATEVIRGRVHGYSRTANTWHTSLLNAETVGGTGLVTTVEDMLTWLRNYGAPRVGDAKLIDMIATPARLTVGGNNYNFGVITKQIAGHQAIVLGGEAEAFRATGFYFPGDDLAVTVMSNNLGALTAKQLAEEVASIYLGSPRPVRAPAPPRDSRSRQAPISAAVANEITGQYRIDELDTTYTLQLEKGQLVVRSLWSVDAEAKRQSEWSLWSPVAVTLTAVTRDRFESNSFAFGVLQPRRDEQGHVVSLEIIEGALQGLRLERVRENKQ